MTDGDTTADDETHNETTTDDHTHAYELQLVAAEAFDGERPMYVCECGETTSNFFKGERNYCDDHTFASVTTVEGESVTTDHRECTTDGCDAKQWTAVEPPQKGLGQFVEGGA